MKYLFSSLLVLFSLSFGFTQCSILGPNELAPGQTITLSTSSSLGQCSACFDWDITSGNGSILGSVTGSSVVVRKNSAGTMTVRVTGLSESGCRSCQLILTDPGSCSQYSVTMNNYYFPGSNSVYLFATPTPSLSGANYTWRVFYGNGSLQQFTTSTSYVEVPLSFGQTIVSTRVTVPFQGCVFSDDVNFVPPIQGGVFFEDPSNEDTPQARKDISEVKVFPNPTTGELNFTGLPITGYTVTIIDNQGNTLIQNHPVDQRLSISDHPSGIYHFVIQSAEGIIQSGRIIKE